MTTVWLEATAPTAACSAATVDTLITLPLGAGRAGAESGERARTAVTGHTPGEQIITATAAMPRTFCSARNISIAPASCCRRPCASLDRRGSERHPA